jgi:tight adherence protein B
LEILFALCVMAVPMLAQRAWATQRSGAMLNLSGVRPVEALGESPSWISRPHGDQRVRAWVTVVGLAAILGFIGGQAAGPLGLIAGGVGGAAIPTIAQRRKARQQAELVERQLADLAEATALAVRSGLSVGQAVEFAHREVGSPLRQAVAELLTQQRLGASFEVAMEGFGEGVGTDDARLFSMILSIHARAGGNLAGALEEVTATVRHRIALRRELRALSAQGRISGLVLASLPIAFSLVLGITSRAKLAPIYSSPAGLAMMGGGLVLEVLAFVWIRRLLRVDA